ncbi:ABC transporter permease [Paraflavitalea speifideaquila]|uniref:ABC transporter permease n=1 Tax=Paraflavitalea speifideaquila TaxID=3076558 RepID=UPI0028E71B5C|nr:ABC transporter permease [Paraflavitalea speifideiaquila]
MAIIALGITALIGINTAIAAIQQKFLESFSSMGATGFTIRFREPRNFFGGGSQLKKNKKARKGRKSPIKVSPLLNYRPRSLKLPISFLPR